MRHCFGFGKTRGECEFSQSVNRIECVLLKTFRSKSLGKPSDSFRMNGFSAAIGQSPAAQIEILYFAIGDLASAQYVSKVWRRTVGHTVTRERVQPSARPVHKRFGRHQDQTDSPQHRV